MRSDPQDMITLPPGSVPHKVQRGRAGHSHFENSDEPRSRGGKVAAARGFRREIDAAGLAIPARWDTIPLA
jgi:hypothetical protein